MKLKEILKNKNISQKDLAVASGLTESAISHYVKGDREPKYKNMVAIAKALNMDFNEVWE